MADTTPPRLRFVSKEALSHDKILITLKVDEGSQVWCAAWTSQPADGAGNPIQAGAGASNYLTLIKGMSSGCEDNSLPPRVCGTFWVYDLDDLEDTASDGVSTQADFLDPGAWRYNEDVSIILTGLTEATVYSHIYCYAEDDETDGVGGVPNKMSYDDVSQPAASRVEDVQVDIGSLTTLDESPPSFTLLQMADPTVAEDKIIVTLQLNEPGTAYCRVTRSDSGEGASEMQVNRILTANWLVTNSGSATSTIEITQLENVVPSATNRDDVVTSILGGTQYDVYCWAKDSAQDTFGVGRPNYDTQTYVGTDVSNPAAPQGGRTAAVWAVDGTPPLMIFVTGEAVTDDGTLQVTLQLNEPGTVWCQAAPLSSAAVTSVCKENEIQETSDTLGACYFETFIKGKFTASSLEASFRADVHTAYVDYDIEVNRLFGKDEVSSEPLLAETGYKIFCFAEDDWKIEADAAILGYGRSPNYVAPTSPNMVDLPAVTTMQQAIGTMTTLDITPPTITIASDTTTETQVTISLTLNEAGTAWCRAVRKGFDMPTVLEILETDFKSTVSSGVATDVVITAYDVAGEPLVLGTDYDVYCFAEDDLCLGCSVPTGVSVAAVQATLHQVRTLDSTPPTMKIVKREAISNDMIQIKLQVDEGAQVWCAAWESDPSLSDANFEGLIKGKAAECEDSQGRVCGTFWIYDLDDLEDTAADGVDGWSDYDNTTVWKFKQDVDIILTGLTSETVYNYIYCYAEDDETDGKGDNANKMAYNLGAVDASKTGIMHAALSPMTTLDESPPSFTSLTVQDPTADNAKIVVTFTLNEAGTVYCRATRTDSGETASDMAINRILTANWASAYANGASQVTIEMSKLENVDISLTNRDDSDVAFAESTQYDIYCLAEDTAVATDGSSRVNLVSHSYVGTPVTDTTAPSGGATASVWVVDSTPPGMVFVRAESVNHETIQMTLQLNEPGTIWCQATELSSVGSSVNCKADDVQDTSTAGDCYFETFVKGNGVDNSFVAFAHSAFSDVEIEVNMIAKKDGSGTAPLEHEDSYNIFCFAEDDWKLEADGAATSSISYAPPAGPNKVVLADVTAFKDDIGPQTTLDETPPSFTFLQIQDPTASDNAIIVSFSLNEVGTAYCRAT
jgi:Zn finger protein HypA/HybF involved in hydrogenase expression